MANPRNPASPRKQPKGDYTHGYARVDPKHQWKKGQSGNPSGGRGPKKVQDEDDVFLEELGRKVNVRVGDDAESLAKLRVGFRQLIDSSAKGHLPAMREVNRKLDRIQVRRAAREASQSVATVERPLSPDEIAALQLAAKLHKAKKG